MRPPDIDDFTVNVRAAGQAAAGVFLDICGPVCSPVTRSRDEGGRKSPDTSRPGSGPFHAYIRRAGADFLEIPVVSKECASSLGLRRPSGASRHVCDMTGSRLRYGKPDAIDPHFTASSMSLPMRTLR